MSYKERLDLHETLNSLRRYVVPLLLERQRGTCDMCKLPADTYDVDHLLYHPEMTINELRLLCIPCHKSITNYVPMRNR